MLAFDFDMLFNDSHFGAVIRQIKLVLKLEHTSFIGTFIVPICIHVKKGKFN